MGLFRDTDFNEKTLSSESVYDGYLLHVYKDTVMLPNGIESGREYIKHVGAVCVVALDGKGNIVVEQQYRYPVGRVVTEIPAGKLDEKGENPLHAAKRELLEETGITADEYEYLGPFYPSCAYSDEVIHMYLAKSLHYGERSLDDDEFLNVGLMPLEELVSMIMNGEIPDGKTQAAVMRVWSGLNSEQKNSLDFRQGL